MSDKKVIITCDSTCDLSPELVERYSIPVNPLFVVLSGSPLKDGVEVKPDDLYDYVEATGSLPSTTAPNVQNYTDFFKAAAPNGESIVHFTISSSMSAAYNNARLAAAELGNVYVVDSKNLSTGSGLLVLKAADLAAGGMEAGDIAAEVIRLSDYVDASFILDTLKFLHKGGRCSAVAALGANLLKLKPCIEVKSGSMGVGKKYRGKLADVFLSYAADRIAAAGDVDIDRVFVTHSGVDEQTVNSVAEKVKTLAPFKEVIVTRAGCTVSVHCGPGTLGVLFIRKNPVK